MNRRFLTLVLLLLCFVSLPAGAQIDKGSIEAVALGQTQSPLPGVTVTVTRPDTGYENVGVTNTVGLARFPFLPPGDYRVAFALEGFAPQAQNVVLRIGANARVSIVDIILKRPNRSAKT